jgi:dimethylhistidine N-methyltransferase
MSTDVSQQDRDHASIPVESEAAQTVPTEAPPDTARDAVLHETLSGLIVPDGQQKTLPPWLFYDDRGSALFQQITQLPEYYLTRTEQSILAENADRILRIVECQVTIAELGSGTAAKTGIILAAAARLQPEVLYQPIDVSAAALETLVRTIPASLPGVRVRPQIANYITEDYKIERPEGTRVLALYIGSSIGNFAPREAISILRKLRAHLGRVGDCLLLGVDLAPNCNKTVEQLIAAYDDTAGITAAFNKNILERLNRELGADFQLESFAHRARWNAAESRIEMHLESLADQVITIDGHRIFIARGETLHTENSYKFTERSVRAMLDESGFSSPQWFEDPQHSFGVVLAYQA